MNKQHWLTVFLDGTVPKEQVFDRVDESFRLISDSPSRRILIRTASLATEW